MTDLDLLIEASRNGDLEAVLSILDKDSQLAFRKDEAGATALHYAALNGHRRIVELLVERGADVNSRDDEFGATPGGWAIEYLRELGGYLAIELDDVAYAIESGDARWLARFLRRFPGIRSGVDRNGTPFQQLASHSENPEIKHLFAADALSSENSGLTS